MSATASLKEILDNYTMAARPELVREEGDAIRCLACGHRCLVKVGRTGVCRVRSNPDGVLRVPAGYAAGVQVDPIEKKPFYHAFPGRDALSFGMLGCDLHCSYCQNWVTSQALRDDRAVSMPELCTAEQLVDLAVARNAPVVVSTYNEPLITSEWAVEVFRRGKEQGRVCGFVSNGNATPEVLQFLRPYVDLYKVDLKTFNDAHYRKLGGVLSNILESIEQLVSMGFWVEIVTLVIPGFNDGDSELEQIAGFLAGISADIPWHVTAFRPDYKMQDTGRTPTSTLLRAFEIGKKAGLHHVYPGNVHGGVGDRENTFCPSCDATIIRRTGFVVKENRMKAPGRCPDCEGKIAGVFESNAPRKSVGTGFPLPIFFE